VVYILEKNSRQAFPADRSGYITELRRTVRQAKAQTPNPWHFASQMVNFKNGSLVDSHYPSAISDMIRLSGLGTTVTMILPLASGRGPSVHSMARRSWAAVARGDVISSSTRDSATEYVSSWAPASGSPFHSFVVPAPSGWKAATEFSGKYYSSVNGHGHSIVRHFFSTAAVTAKYRWHKLEPMDDDEHGRPCTRSSHGLSMVQNGSRLIVHGGEHIARTPLERSQATWAADYNKDDATWKWRLITTTGDESSSASSSSSSSSSSSTLPPRVGHAQAAFNDTTVYVFGGRRGIGMDERGMNDLWKLDCSGPGGSETWSLVTPNLEQGDAPPEERSFHQMLCVGNSLYVFGGCSVGHGRLADLHRFNIDTNTWQNLGASSFLKGRGGASFMTLASGNALGVVAGFIGEESNDGHVFHLMESNKWADAALTPQLKGLRPRSVCVSGSFPSIGVSVVVGGEVDPSAKGHEGAGGFENDIVLLDEKTGAYLGTTACPPTSVEEGRWPEQRGWADAASLEGDGGIGHLYLFGGLTGDDANPKRLNDLWRLDVGA
jgi:hypothetical protein